MNNLTILYWHENRHNLSSVANYSFLSDGFSLNSSKLMERPANDTTNIKNQRLTDPSTMQKVILMSIALETNMKYLLNLWKISINFLILNLNSTWPLQIFNFIWTDLKPLDVILTGTEVIRYYMYMKTFLVGL